MTFTPTEGQSKALDMVRVLQKCNSKEPKIGVLRGYAGTGKTASIRMIAEEFGDLDIIAPTGKAAARVKELTGQRACTIHSYLYEAVESPLTGEFTFNLKPLTEPPISRLIVVEEASMVSEDMWDDIYGAATTLHCNILCVGDPFQLPPVEDTKNPSGFGLLLPDFKFDYEVTLTEITRQAAESPVIRSSMMVREGRLLEALLEIPRVSVANLLQEQVAIQQSGGFVLCHSNATRHELNKRVRAELGFSDRIISDGEPLLVLRNNKELQMYNGEVHRFEEWIQRPSKSWAVYDRYKNAEQPSSFGVGLVGGKKCALATQGVIGKLELVGPRAISDVARAAVGKQYSYLHCNFGYTLTTFKAQGSEANDVLIIVERTVRPFTTEGRRFLYTSITRAIKSVKLVWLAGQNDPQIVSK